jgi:Flp pilus assembly protein protease CpaA
MVVGAWIGEMLIPLTVANVSFKWYNPVTFLYILLACSIRGLFVYVAMLLIGRPLAQAKQASRHATIVDEDEELSSGAFGDSSKSPAYGTFSNEPLKD